jgi:DNA-binding transcriptional MocR family regulator
MTAISAVRNLENSLISATSAPVAGRNLKLTQERIQSLVPKPGQLLTSSSKAVSDLSALKATIEEDMNDLRILGSERSGASESDKSKAGQAFRDLQRNRDNINVIIDNLTAERRPQQQQAPQQRGRSLAGLDQQALAWVNDPKNANDPRLAAIKQRLGVQ